MTSIHGELGYQHRGGFTRYRGIEKTSVKRQRNARVRGRLGGLASGRKRRALARGKRRTHDGRLIRGGYRVVQPPSRDETERRFRELGQRFHCAGYETADAVARILWRWQCVKGPDFELTNMDIEVALGNVGRSRCRRTVQLTRARLVAMGLIQQHHVKRSGQRRIRGEMDTIRIRVLRLRQKDCTPPTARGNPPEGREVPSLLTAKTPLDPPTSSAENEPAAAPPPSTERGKLEAAIAFHQLRLDCGWGPSAGLVELKHRLRRIQERDDHASP